MVGDQPIVLPEQGEESYKHIPQPRPLAPAQQPQTLDPHPQPQAQVTHLFSRPEFSMVVIALNAHPAAPTMRAAEAAGNKSSVDVDLVLLGELAGGESFQLSLSLMFLSMVSHTLTSWSPRPGFLICSSPMSLSTMFHFLMSLSKKSLSQKSLSRRSLLPMSVTLSYARVAA